MTFAALISSRIDRFEFAPFGSNTRTDHVYLFVGADSGIERQSGQPQYSEDGSARADVVLLVRVAENSEVSIVSVPRDIVVSHGGKKQRLASTLLDGPGAVVEGVCTGLGVSVDRYVQIDTNGFIRTVDALGGIEVEVPTAIRDPYSGLDLDAGEQQIGGEEALALVRSRHAETSADGSWRGATEGQGAKDRTHAAAYVFAALKDKAVESGPFVLGGTAWVVSEDITVGGGLHPYEWLQMFRASFEPVVLPVEDIGSPLAVKLGDKGKAVLDEVGFNTGCAD